ncbi:MAG: phospholipase D family protein [Natrialbaceae archaeon]|nr:phospholipase D family protein [Natrialbaceae archaeon]
MTIEATSGLTLLGTRNTDRTAQAAIADLLAGDGTVYLISGYFTYQGYRTIRPHIVEFLERSRENELIVIVGPASDQFSARIAYDLWSLNDHDQISLLKQRRGLHAKLYLRDGNDAHCIIGSANITQVAFKYNIELGLEFNRDSIDHPDIAPFHDWAETMVEQSRPLRRRDLLVPAQVGSSFLNWSNKARLLPVRNVAIRVMPILLALVVLATLFRFI